MAPVSGMLQTPVWYIPYGLRDIPQRGLVSLPVAAVEEPYLRVMGNSVAAVPLYDPEWYPAGGGGLAEVWRERYRSLSPWRLKLITAGRALLPLVWLWRHAVGDGFWAGSLLSVEVTGLASSLTGSWLPLLDTMVAEANLPLVWAKPALSPYLFAYICRKFPAGQPPSGVDVRVRWSYLMKRWEVDMMTLWYPNIGQWVLAQATPSDPTGVYTRVSGPVGSKCRVTWAGAKHTPWN